jgi:tRNA/rRNA methyltransferase
MRVVLVRPRDPNNIGAAARAMANFGLSDLVVVAPFEPVWREARSAVGAGEVLARARLAATLDEAVGGSRFVGATTAGTRRRLERVVTPAEFVAEACALGGADDACLVFGNEKHGLAAGEVARCHVAVRIATAAMQPSMNLGQAVAVCCYEASLARAGAGALAAPRRRERPATIDEVAALVAAAVPEAEGASPGVAGRRDAARARLRSLLLAARATPADLALLRGLLVPSSDNDPTSSA